MAKILAFSGKKQSGKNTVCNYLVGRVMKQLGIVQNKCAMTEKGELWISDIFGDEDEGGGIFDLSRRDGEMFTFLENNVHPYVKIYSFADLLKEYVCMAVLGLSYQQCYGTDEQKNSATHLKWENMPGIVTPNEVNSWANYETGSGGNLLDHIDYEGDIDTAITITKNRSSFNNKEWILGTTIHESGNMTAREVMQYVGTDMFRKMWGPVWADATMRSIKQENTLLALICDCRFENEVDAVNDAGGKVVRFAGSFAGDTTDGHSSENALGDDYGGFARTIQLYPEGKRLGVNDQCYGVKLFCEEFGYLPKTEGQK